jgi:hypothetical protein
MPRNEIILCPDCQKNDKVGECQYGDASNITGVENAKAGSGEYWCDRCQIIFTVNGVKRRFGTKADSSKTQK